MESHKPATTLQPKVLFASGEQSALNSIQLMFGHRFTLFLVSDTPTALDVLKQHDIDVIVADHQMPQMSGIALLRAAHTLSLRAARILLSADAELDAIETCLDDVGVFRLLTKPYEPDRLRAAMDLAVKVARRGSQHAPALPVDPEQQLVHDILSQDPSELPPSLAAEIIDDWSQTMTEQALEATDVIEPAEPAPVTPIQQHRDAKALIQGPENGVIVFSLDHNVVESIRHAAHDRFSVYFASNIVQVVKTLRERRPGVLVTDITQDRDSIQSMTAQLKRHVPELVTIIVSEHGNSPDIVWLINHGQVFRFLSKPVSSGRCAVSIRAALQYHATLRELVNENESALDGCEDSGIVSGVFEKLRSVRRLWA